VSYDLITQFLRHINLGVHWGLIFQARVMKLVLNLRKRLFRLLPKGHLDISIKSIVMNLFLAKFWDITIKSRFCMFFDSFLATDKKFLHYELHTSVTHFWDYLQNMLQRGIFSRSPNFEKISWLNCSSQIFDILFANTQKTWLKIGKSIFCILPSSWELSHSIFIISQTYSNLLPSFLHQLASPGLHNISFQIL
jgi:hypothetical protein